MKNQAVGWVPQGRRLGNALRGSLANNGGLSHVEPAFLSLNVQRPPITCRSAVHASVGVAR